MSGPALAHYNVWLPIIVAADASDCGLDAVLLHKFSDGNQKAISHVFRPLNTAEKHSQV